MICLLLLINYTYLLSLSSSLMDMTINNPIFIFTVITIVWFLPGIIVKRITETNKENKRKKNQNDAIEKLYPKK